MTSFSLASYAIRVKDKKRNLYVPQIDNFAGGADIFDIFDRYLNILKNNLAHDHKHKKLMQVIYLNSNHRILNGIIETGEYGYESNLCDINSGSVSHRRQIHEAEMVPFYSLISLPRKVDEGIIILQRFKQFGIRKVLLGDFNNYFASQCPNFSIEVNPLIPEQLVSQYLHDGRITKIRFIRFSIPRDVADAYDVQGHVEEEGYTELVVSARRNKHIPILGRIHEFLNGNRELRGLIELQNFEYDTVKVEVEINKNHRTIDLANLHKIRAYYDITEEVQISDSGHPSFDSIDTVAMRLLGDLSEAIGRRREF